jgi:hypothetical protein
MTKINGVIPQRPAKTKNGNFPLFLLFCFFFPYLLFVKLKSGSRK